jgi:opacity protein-like surface antigen
VTLKKCLLAFTLIVLSLESDGQDGANHGLKPGYKGIVEVGLGIPAGDYGETRVKLNVINGIQFNPHTSLGIGIGLSGYYDRMLIPIFADFRYYFLKKNVAPYLSFDTGYSFNADNSFKGQGFLWSILFGIDLNLSGNFSIHLGAGYDSQKMDWSDSHISLSAPVRITEYDSGMSEAILINLGFSF